MRLRHRVPSVFSLSMVDVLCCALGCVILLWLLGAKQLDDEAADLRAESSEALEKARAENAESAALLEALRTDKTRQEATLGALQSDRDGARALLANLRGEIGKLQATRTDLEKQLAARVAEAADLAGLLKTSARRVTALETEMAGNSAALDKERLRSGGLGKQLAELEALVKALKTDLDGARARYDTEEGRSRALAKEIAGQKVNLSALTRSVEDMTRSRTMLEKALEERERALTAALPFKERATVAESRVAGLERQLTEMKSALGDATRSVAALDIQKRELEGAVSRFRSASDGRFAGIQLSGKRVVFLVDVSGSMELVDETTPAPAKWPEVCETVARVMRSLPELEKYQVVTFAAKVAYPLGGDGEWFDHDPKASPEKALKALKAVKPNGGTNMYDALEAAFRYRKQGLDTIYLLSDGLPNQGKGLPPGVEIREAERGQLLGRHVRKTLRTEWNLADVKQPRVKINTIGFFYESPDLGAFLWALARENDGSFVGMSRP